MTFKNIKAVTSAFLLAGSFSTAFAAATETYTTVHADSEIKSAVTGGFLRSYISSYQWNDLAIEITDAGSSNYQGYVVDAFYIKGDNKSCANSTSANGASTNGKSCYVSYKTNNGEVWNYGILSNGKLTQNVVNVSPFKKQVTGIKGVSTTIASKDDVTKAIQKIAATTYSKPNDDLWRIRFMLTAFYINSTEMVANPYVYWDYTIPAKSDLYVKSLTQEGITTGENRNTKEIQKFVLSKDALTLRTSITGYDKFRYRYIVSSCRHANSEATSCNTAVRYTSSYKEGTVSSSHVKIEDIYKGELYLSPLDASATVQIEVETATHYDKHGTGSGTTNNKEYFETTLSNTIAISFAHLVETKTVSNGKTNIAGGPYANIPSNVVNKGDNVTYYATPDAGYTFSGWYDRNNKFVSNQNGLSVKILRDTLLYPKFTAASKSGNLTISSFLRNGKNVNCSNNCDFVYESDELGFSSKFSGSGNSALTAKLYAEENGSKTLVETKTINASDLTYGKTIAWDSDNIKAQFLNSTNPITWTVSYGYGTSDLATTSGITITKKFPVTFKNDDETVLDEQLVAYGKDATPPTPPQKDGYAFKAWDVAYTNITGNTVTKATYVKIPKFAFTVNTDNLVGGNTPDDVQVTQPSKCFIVSKSVTLGDETQEEINYSKEQTLKLNVFVDTKGDCAEDELVSSWLGMEGTSEACVATINEVEANANVCETANYTANEFELSYNFKAPDFVENFVAITVTTDKDGNKTAELDCDSKLDAELHITKDIPNVNVSIKRTFPTNTAATIMLPFEISTADIEGLSSVSEYTGQTTNNGVMAAEMTEIWATGATHITLEPYKPYMVELSSDKLVINTPVTLKATPATPNNTTVSTASGSWEFQATYSYKTWDESDYELGSVYGFAASDDEDNNIKIGDFVKVAAGAWISPMRAYLVYHKPAPKVAAHRIAGTQYSAKTNASSEALPEKMDVIVKRLNGKTTSIGSINLRTGDFRMNRNFDLKGRHVGENKKARGAYYGKKILRD